jgi:2-keto-3-deoxy-L-fuconate dehydrogenase
VRIGRRDESGERGSPHTSGTTWPRRFHSLETRCIPLSDLEHSANLFRLDGKVAVVTGAGSGIGKAIAGLFVASGAEVWILDLDEEAARKTASQITETGGSARALRCDVANETEVREVFQNLLHVKPLNILVNNAGVSHIGNLESTTSVEFARIFEVNVKGVYHCMQAAIPAMKGNGGVILNMASIAGSAGLTDRFAYSMSKGAVRAMTLSVAKDYLEYKIRCNCISPARVHTPFVDGYLQTNYPNKKEEMFRALSASQPIGRMARPVEVAFLALFLCSDQAAFLTGVDYPLDGGFFNLRG